MSEPGQQTFSRSLDHFGWLLDRQIPGLGSLKVVPMVFVVDF
jgi:hypothetical protein